MKIHFIAIGGAVMHNLAIAMHQKGHHVTGSDEEIFEPSYSRLMVHGLLPEKNGWNANRILPDLDMVILGMQAKKSNPELRRAQEYGIPIYSFPEYLYEQSIHKKRIVIGGSHGKTTITAMVMHVLSDCGMKFDYMVGSQIEGFDPMVKLTDDAPYIILEGDEYLTSPLDPRPKFHLYCPHTTLLSGIAWDHMNAFRTFDEYKKQFRQFLDYATGGGKVFYYAGDPVLCELVDASHWSLLKIPYQEHPYFTDEGRFVLDTRYGQVPLILFGRHNMENIQGALLICRELGVKDHQFYESIRNFKGAERRQQLLASGNNRAVYLDFAHAPANVNATVEAFKAAFQDQTLIACLELYSESSLNMEFLPQFKGSLDKADLALIYFNPTVVKQKGLPPLMPAQVKEQFGRDDLVVCDDPHCLESGLKGFGKENYILLMMTSGNFSGIVLQDLAKEMVRC
jgi:UDP-N-acetylmuramate: L-alanyl-gamma-D-glutamyl-meso-diaminopimelate ligase